MVDGRTLRNEQAQYGSGSKPIHDKTSLTLLHYDDFATTFFVLANVALVLGPVVRLLTRRSPEVPCAWSHCRSLHVTGEVVYYVSTEDRSALTV